ncbi:MAG: DUF1080 domain-containing protein [Planctomycetes bacterium]|nr:DUF1080 domain-containing protein [Planctomycetota bacterium]
MTTRPSASPSVRRSAAHLAAAVVVGLAWAVPTTNADESGFESLFDGKSLAGWKASENVSSWTVVDGQIVCHGPRSHLFYVGSEPASPLQFKNFHLKAEVLTKPKANSGIYFHTRYQDNGWPSQGHEAQVNNTSGDPVRTGSLYNVVKNLEPPAKDDQWFTEEVIVEGNRIVIKVDGKTIVDHVEKTAEIRDGRKLSAGTFALQAHDPGSEVHYRNIRVKRLPD